MVQDKSDKALEFGESDSLYDEKANKLFPVFFKLENLTILLIGGGYVAFEKLKAILNQAPQTSIHLVAQIIDPRVEELSKQYPKIRLSIKKYESADLAGMDLVFAAVNDKAVTEQIYHDAKSAGVLINAADQPDLCDFYLGSIVQKGNLKIAISTNGKSPTIAKRIKEVIQDLIPDEVDEVLTNMHTIRNSIHGNFDDKVKHLNELTKVLISKQAIIEPTKNQSKKWSRIVLYCILAFVVILVAHALLSLVHFEGLVQDLFTVVESVNSTIFLMMVLTGFIAQLIDGSMGLGFGTISTTFLLALGVPPAIVSSRVHSARVFSSGVAGFSHNRYGNINKKLFRTIVWPGALGAILGAALAVFAQHKNFTWVRLPLSIYTTYLGYYIIRKAFRKKQADSKVKRAGWLAAVGGFMDAFAGGGWGALVTSTLISKRKTPRYVIGSVCLAEFFVVLSSAVTFFILLNQLPLMEVIGLILGGVIAGPIAARLVGKVPIKTMYLLVGLIVILTSCFTFYKVFIKLI